MQAVIISYIALVGLVIGSFLNVLIYRIPLKISVSKGFSFCPQCHHRLIWIDLFPVFSYLLLGGKCRYCKAPIRLRYPLVELLNGICYVGIYLTCGLTLSSLLYAIVSSCLITLAFIDIDYHIIPDRFHIIIGVCGLMLAFFTPDYTWLEHLIGLFAVSVPVFLIALLTGGMGEGDVKLFAVCGFLMGWKLILLTMLFASVVAAGYGILLMLRKKADKKTEIPFGPFIALGTMLSLFFGDALISWYLSLLTGV